MCCRVINFIIKHTSQPQSSTQVIYISTITLTCSNNTYFIMIPLESVQCSDECVAQKRDLALWLVPWRRPCSCAGCPVLMNWKKQEDQDEKQPTTTLANFQHIRIRHLPSIESDHCYVVAEIKENFPNMLRAKKQIRYENVWASHVDYD